MHRLYLIIPILDEAENLPGLLTSIRKLRAQFKGTFDLKCLLVDDGSNDRSSETANQLKGDLDLEILRHPVNLGPGAAFATAFAALSNRLHNDDWVVTMEGDNTSRSELLQQMITRSKEGFDVVLASPYMYGGGLSNTNALRSFLSFVANFFVKEALGLRGLLTMSSFYRLYRGSAILRLQKSYGPGIIECKGFESMVELLMKLVFFRFSISEVAMHLDSSVRLGKSKMRILKTTMGYLLIWTKKAKWLSRATAPELLVELNPAFSANQSSPLTPDLILFSPDTPKDDTPLKRRSL